MKYLLLFILLLAACKTPKPTTTTKGSTKVVETDQSSQPTSPKLVFLVYKMSKTAQNEIAIELTDKIVTKGTMKEGLQEELAPEEGDLYCVQLDAKSRPIQRELIKNPFHKIVEYVDESGKLNKKQIKLDTVEVPIRMRVHSNTKHIAIEEYVKPSKLLIKHEL